MRSWSTITKRWFTSSVAVAAALLVAGSAGFAQEQERARERAGDASRADAAAVAIDAPNARMAALVRAGGTVVMSKGVDSVVRIDTGVYCIKPAASTGINPQTAIVSVSIEYFYSLFNEVTVQWARRGSGCGNNRFGVYTFADKNLDTVYSPSNAVGFVIVVP